MPPNIKTKVLGHSDSAKVADADNYAFLSDDFENVALAATFSTAMLDSGSVKNQVVKVVSSGRKCCVQSKRKAVCSQPKYVF